jgi:hypothetical protein
MDGLEAILAMDTTLLIVVAIVAVLLLVALLVAVKRASDERRRSQGLRERFGPEYERTLEAAGNRRQAEAELEARQTRVAALPLRTLSAQEQEGLRTNWRAAQARFVDEPAQSIAMADRLVTEGMRARGYPVGDFEQRVADLSVEHAEVINHYREARRLAQASEAGLASTEDLRQAMVHYRALFDDLLTTASEAEQQKEMVR